MRIDRGATATAGRRVRAGIAIGLFALALAGCSAFGPGTVERDRIDYSSALSESFKEQTLLNIVRLRYADMPTFMDVSSVIGGYSFGTQVSPSALFNLAPPHNPVSLPGAVGSVTGTAAFADRPTISYTPLTGDKFTKSLLTPIPPSAIFSLISAGYPADLILQVTVRALNGVYNRSDAGGGGRPADPAFYPLLDALRRLQLSDSVSLRVEKRGPDSVGLVVISGERSPEAQRDSDFVRKTLNLTPDAKELTLTYGAVQRSDVELAVLSRSMIEILREIAAGIEVPADKVAQGRTFANPEIGPDADPRDRPYIRIHSGPTPPADAYAAVRYRDAWYWIDSRDLATKRIFTFLLIFFSLAETGVVPQAPVLTVPVP